MKKSDGKGTEGKLWDLEWQEGTNKQGMGWDGKWRGENGAGWDVGREGVEKEGKGRVRMGWEEKS